MRIHAQRSPWLKTTPIPTDYRPLSIGFTTLVVEREETRCRSAWPVTSIHLGHHRGSGTIRAGDAKGCAVEGTAPTKVTHATPLNLAHGSQKTDLDKLSKTDTVKTYSLRLNSTCRLGPPSRRTA